MSVYMEFTLQLNTKYEYLHVLLLRALQTKHCGGMGAEEVNATLVSK